MMPKAAAPAQDMPPARDSRLTRRVLFWVIAICVLMFSAVTAVTVLLERNGLYQKAQQDAQGNVTRNLAAISTGLWNFDTVGLKATLQGLTQTGSIIRAEVLGGQQQVAAAEREYAGSPERQWEVTLVAPDGAEKIGTLKISESYKQVRDLFARNLATELVAELVKIVGLAALLFIIIYRLITRHLRTLARDVADLKPGAPNVPIVLRRKKPRNDELDTLANAINRFRHERAEAEQALQDDIAMRRTVEAALQDSEARLRSSEERLKLAIDAAGLGIWDWDVEGDRLVWDDSMVRLYGVRAQDFGDSFDAWLQYVVPEDVAQAKADVEAALRGERDYLSRFRVRRADGAIRVMRGLAMIIRNADGSPVRMVGINRDVTELVNAERERDRATEAVQAAQAELAQVARLTTMGELAASIAHEISQPLAAVVSYGNGALRWLARAPPDLTETRAALEGIVAAGNHAGAVLARIRELLKHRKPEYVALDVNQAIEDVLALTGGALRGRAVTVRTTLAAGLPLVRGDRVQLQQVIMNLAINAADAMDSLTDRPRVLRVASELGAKGSVQVTVADSGTGIDEAIRHSIFEPLFTTKSKGMGMGLSICRSIIEAHGGRLWASPGTPHGTEFQFTIPLSNRSPAAA
jgi:PAS domain S-box-containing protein